MRAPFRRSSSVFCGIAEAIVLTLMTPLVGLAQNEIKLVSGPVRYAEPAEMLARLESGKVNVSVGITEAFKGDRQINDSTLILGNYDRYTDAQRDEILDGVERIAQGVEGGGLTVANAKMEAFSVLSALANDPELSETYEIPDRLLRIYDHAKTDDVRGTVVWALGRVLRNSPTASPRIVKLLVSLVNQPVVIRHRGFMHGSVQVAGGPVHPDDAVDALLSACEAGVPVLRQLQANRGAIKLDAVRARVDSLARAGFAPGRMRLASDGMNPCTRDQGR